MSTGSAEFGTLGWASALKSWGPPWALAALVLFGAYQLVYEFGDRIMTNQELVTERQTMALVRLADAFERHEVDGARQVVIMRGICVNQVMGRQLEGEAQSEALHRCLSVTEGGTAP